jgi:hypothetical protein
VRAKQLAKETRMKLWAVTLLLSAGLLLPTAAMADRDDRYNQRRDGWGWSGDRRNDKEWRKNQREWEKERRKAWKEREKDRREAAREWRKDRREAQRDYGRDRYYRDRSW